MKYSAKLVNDSVLMEKRRRWQNRRPGLGCGHVDRWWDFSQTLGGVRNEHRVWCTLSLIFLRGTNGDSSGSGGHCMWVIVGTMSYK